MSDEKMYTEQELQTIVNKVRVEERYIANTVLGDAGIPVERRPKIYSEAGQIVMNMILAPPKKPEPDPGTD